MKIVNIIYSGLGGHAAVVFALIEGDKFLQNSHTIIFYGVESLPIAYSDKCNSLGITFFTVLKKSGFDLNSVKQITSLLGSVKPDVIILHTINLIISVSKYARTNNVTLISVEHQSNELKLKKEWFFSLLLMFLSDKVVYLTDIYRLQMKQKFKLLFRNKKVSVINNGINLALYKPSIFQHPYASTLHIGMLSRLMPTKDHGTLILSFAEILKKYKGDLNIILNIAGDGTTMENLKSQVLHLSIENNVIFKGMIPESKSIDFLNEQDIYVHASMGETMSTSIMQAMACNKAIIASDVAGINNMLENEKTALLVPPKNKEKLTEAFIRLIENDFLKNRLRKNAFKFAKHNFSNEIMFHKYYQLFKQKGNV